MRQYYYLAATLPQLVFAQASSIDAETFIAEAGKWMDKEELGLLRQAEIDKFHASDRDTYCLARYKEFERGLREVLFLSRSNGKKPGPEWGRDPLQREKNLLFLRWQKVEELGPGHIFDLDFFVLYRLKLDILEKYFSFDKNKGQEAFDRLCEVKL